jgi:hypothetical protein
MPLPLVEAQSGRLTDGGFEIESPEGWRVRVPASFKPEVAATICIGPCSAYI